MSCLCVIYGNRPLISETFISLQIDGLSGKKCVLHNWYPEYTYEGRTIRYFYSRTPLLRKLERLLPVFVYDRLAARRRDKWTTILDFFDGFFSSHGVDCILAQYGTNGADIAPVAKALGIPLVVHFHGHEAHRGETLSAYRGKYPQMFEYASSVISVSRRMTRALLELGCPSGKIVENPYGAREEFFQIRPDYEKVLFAVGRFADIKSPALTINAFRIALEAHPDAVLVMVGDGPLLECCRQLVRSYGIGESVQLLGAMPQYEFIPLMQRARAFVQHSVTTHCGDSEGTPNSILEAQAAGLPVIATRHAGINEAVVDGTTGLLCGEYDVEVMSRCMKELLSDRARAVSMGENARAHIRANYTTGRYLSTIERLILEARSAGSIAGVSR